MGNLVNLARKSAGAIFVSTIGSEMYQLIDSAAKMRGPMAGFELGREATRRDDEWVQK